MSSAVIPRPDTRLARMPGQGVKKKSTPESAPEQTEPPAAPASRYHAACDAQRESGATTFKFKMNLVWLYYNSYDECRAAADRYARTHPAPLSPPASPSPARSPERAPAREEKPAPKRDAAPATPADDWDAPSPTRRSAPDAAPLPAPRESFDAPTLPRVEGEVHRVDCGDTSGYDRVCTLQVDEKKFSCSGARDCEKLEKVAQMEHELRDQVHKLEQEHVESLKKLQEKYPAPTGEEPVCRFTVGVQGRTSVEETSIALGHPIACRGALILLRDLASEVSSLIAAATKSIADYVRLLSDDPALQPKDEVTTAIDALLAASLSEDIGRHGDALKTLATEKKLGPAHIDRLIEELSKTQNAQLLYVMLSALIEQEPALFPRLMDSIERLLNISQENPAVYGIYILGVHVLLRACEGQPGHAVFQKKLGFTK